MTESSPPQNRFGFPMTRWTLVDDAKGVEPAQIALMDLYYRPVRAFFLYLSRKTQPPLRDVEAYADDLTQDFFLWEWTHLIKKDGGIVHHAERTRGRFRNLLMKSMTHFWLIGLRHMKKDELSPVIPEDEDEWNVLTAKLDNSSNLNDAERVFFLAWIENLVAQVLQEVEAICQKKGQDQHFQVFIEHYFPTQPCDDSWEGIAQRHGLKDGKSARNLASTVTAHVKKALISKFSLEHAEREIPQEIRDILTELGEDHD